MTYQEIAERATKLPLQQRLALLELLTRSLRADLVPTQTASVTEKLAAIDRLAGALQTEAPAPTDQELKDDYITYLTQKYA